MANEPQTTTDITYPQEDPSARAMYEALRERHEWAPWDEAGPFVWELWVNVVRDMKAVGEKIIYD